MSDHCRPLKGAQDSHCTLGILTLVQAGITVLDANGTILAANKPWEEIAAANGLAESDSGVGGSYLRIYDSAGPHPLAIHIAQGIRKVLNGTLHSFSSNYESSDTDLRREFPSWLAPCKVTEAIVPSLCISTLPI